MELHIKDRLYIPQLLPQKGNFMEFAMKREILKKVAITEADVERYEIKQDAEANKIEWNIDKDRAQPFTVDFSQAELEFIKKGCEALADIPAPDDLWVVVEKIYNSLA